MVLEFRKAQPHDIEEICSLVSSVKDNLIKQRIFQWDDLYPVRNDFEKDIRKQQLYVGLIEGHIVILYVLNQECEEAYKNGKWKYNDKPFYIIHRLCVHPAFQNKGIATCALSHIEAELKTKRIYAVRLDVFTENPYAIKLYETSGYENVGYADWRKGRFYLMEKQL